MEPSIPGKPIAYGRTAEIYDWEPGKILKLYQQGWSENIVRYEAEMTHQANATGYRVPVVFGQVEVNGRPGLILEKRAGVPLTQSILKQPWKTTQLGQEMGRLHAEMHTYQAPGLTSQKERLRNKIDSVKGAPEPIKQAALDAVETLPDGTQLCHNDFHPENILHSETQLTVIDWIDATSGHPLADVSRTLLLLTLGELPDNLALRLLVAVLRNRFIKSYQYAYFSKSAYSPAELKPFQLPVAFARLSEDIAPERGRLVKFIQQSYPA